MILSAAPLSGIAQLDLSGLFALKASSLNASGQLTDTISWTYDEEYQDLFISGSGRIPDYDLQGNYSPFYDNYYFSNVYFYYYFKRNI